MFQHQLFIYSNCSYVHNVHIDDIVHKGCNIHNVHIVHNVHKVHNIHPLLSSIIRQSTTVLQLQICLSLSLHLEVSQSVSHCPTLSIPNRKI